MGKARWTRPDRRIGARALRRYDASKPPGPATRCRPENTIWLGRRGDSHRVRGILLTGHAQWWQIGRTRGLHRPNPV